MFVRCPWFVARSYTGPNMLALFVRRFWLVTCSLVYNWRSMCEHITITSSVQTCYKHCTNMLRTLYEHVTNTLRTPKLRTCYEHATNTLRTYYEHATNTLRTYYEHATNTLRTCYEHLTNMLRTCSPFMDTTHQSLPSSFVTPTIAHKNPYSSV